MSDTVALPRKLVEQTIVALESWLTNSERAKAAEALRAALTCTENAKKCTRSENVSKNEQKVYTSDAGPVCMISCAPPLSQAEQHHLRSEYLTNKHKTDWSAS